MSQYLQTILLGLVILMLLTAFSVNADTPKTMTSQIGYSYYYLFDELEMYHRFLPIPAPEGLHYLGRMKAIANIDDTPEKERIILIVVDTEPRTFSNSREGRHNWRQAFLLITDTKSYQDRKKKALFKLFDTRTDPLEVPTAKVVELHEPPSDFKHLTDVSFRLIDATGDGILDIWVESAHGVALISFQNGEFTEVFSNYTVTREKLAEVFDVEYHSYDAQFDPEGEKYHRFLTTPKPEGPDYETQQKVIANIDNTPEKETIVLMVTLPKGEWVEWGQWAQAFLLIAQNEAKKELFELFNSGWDLDISAKTIPLQSPPFVLREATSTRPWSSHVSFKLIDLTGDGILDIWVESYDGLVVISFQDGEFKAVCSSHSSFKKEDPIEYIDLDNDGIYEIKIPTRITMDGVPGASYPEWMSFYEWDGNTYVLNNERFYTENDAFVVQLLEDYNFWRRFAIHETYSYYIGLAFYYRGNVPMARAYLQWVVKNAKNDDYIQAAKSLLKKLTSH